MFITTDVSSSKNYTEAVERFKTEISRQCKDSTNESLRLLPSKLPDKIHSGQAAWLLASKDVPAYQRSEYFNTCRSGDGGL